MNLWLPDKFLAVVVVKTFYAFAFKLKP
uniref:Uncharacterized protein n=1 Tax=Arundo donax TaxID=35708 RepID=A0A0A9CAZ4_ARUDO